jgi:hypothetical protein
MRQGGGNFAQIVDAYVIESRDASMNNVMAWKTSPAIATAAQILAAAAYGTWFHSKTRDKLLGSITRGEFQNLRGVDGQRTMRLLHRQRFFLLSDPI